MDSSFRRAPIAVALDAPDLGTLRSWARATAPWVSTMKVGVEVFCRDGAAAVQAARNGAMEAGGTDIFLDLKLHDIPATVAGAARAVADLEPTYLTVHASGGADMVHAAAQALPETKIVAVTILTSLDDAALHAIGMSGPSLDAVVRLAKLSVAAGARAIVCSPLEVSAVRSVVPPDIVLITPGVRPAGAQMQDQKRVATPASALADGSDLLVIGRPITAAEDPARAAQTIAESIRP